MTPVRKYPGRRPSKMTVDPVFASNDAFDRLLGPRRSPHPFSSSSEAIPTPSPGLPEEPSSADSSPRQYFQFLDPGEIRVPQKRVKPRLASRVKKSGVKKTTFGLEHLHISKWHLILKESCKKPIVPIGTSTPIARVRRSSIKAKPSLSPRSSMDSITSRLCGINLSAEPKREQDGATDPSLRYVARRKLRVVSEDAEGPPKSLTEASSSSSGSSSDVFHSMDSVPSTSRVDRSNSRRRPFNEFILSPRNSLREELMSSSEDEDDSYADMLSRPSDVALCPLYERSVLEPLHENAETDDDDENSSLSSESSSAKKSPVDSLDSSRTPNMRRKASRHSEERSPTGRSSISGRASITPELVSVMEEPLELFVLQPGKKYRRSLHIIKTGGEMGPGDVLKGKRYTSTVEEVLRLQTSHNESMANTPVQLIRKKISVRRSSYLKQITPPPRRRRTVLPKIPDQTVDPTADRDKVLNICGQATIAQFKDVFSHESFKGCSKIGEGVYAEVFALKKKTSDTVIKIMPVEGSLKVNDAMQRKFGEMLPELIVSKCLHELKDGASNGGNKCGGFAEIIDMKVLQGSYPQELVDAWDTYDRKKGSENDRPAFPDGQLYIIIEQRNGGTALEEYKFNTANAAYSVFKQVTFALAVAEQAYCFEHRDLHVGNVLVARTKDSTVTYVLNSRDYAFPTIGVKATIIDYTLSRLTSSEGPLFNDLAKDPELFLGTGDYQFEVYRKMKTDVSDDWSVHQAKTNVRWLHYLADKLLTKTTYHRETAKVHVERIQALRRIEGWIESCGSAGEVAEKISKICRYLQSIHQPKTNARGLYYLADKLLTRTANCRKKAKIHVERIESYRTQDCSRRCRKYDTTKPEI